mgnify:CR=1 FL=1
MILRYCGNTYDPREPDYQRHIVRSFHEWSGDVEDHSVKHHNQWIRSKLIGDPGATDTYTTEQLSGMKMVGVYMEEVDDYGKAHPELVVDYHGELFQYDPLFGWVRYYELGEKNDQSIPRT